MDNNNNNIKLDYTSLSKTQIKFLSEYYLMHHAECLRIQKKLDIEDEFLPCKLFIDEHFKFFRLTFK